MLTTQMDKQELGRVVLSDGLEVCVKQMRWAGCGQHQNDDLPAKASVEYPGRATAVFSYKR